MKRLLALVLSLVMALSLCVPAWGAGADADGDGLPDDLPKATVTNAPQHENTVLDWETDFSYRPTEGLDSQLEAAYIFECADVAGAATSPYAEWYCDFYVKLNQNLGENQIFLGGNYGTWGWIGFHNGDLTLDANKEIPLLGSVTKNPWTYADVASFVGTFTCGVGDVKNALAGATFTVMLRLTNPDDETEYYNVATIEYTFDDVNRAKAANSDELATAVANGATEIELAAGNYTLPNVQGKNITLIGAGTDTVVDYSHMGGYQEVSGSSFVFKNMTVKNVEAGYPYKGLQHTTSVAYENCHILGTVNLFAPATFTSCTFDSRSAEHNVVTYGSDSVIFTDCEFTYADRSVNCYAENASERDVVVTFNDCTFTKVAGKDTTGAIETNSCYMKSLTLNINDCTVNEGDLWWVSTWDSTDGAKTTTNVKYTVSFNANGGSGTMESKVVAAGAYELPANGFTAPSGKQFKGWTTSENGAVITEKTYTVSAPTTFYAVWESIPVYYPPVVNTPVETPTETPETPAETPAATPTTPAQPTATPSTEVSVPVGGNENTVKVEATVTGTTATVDKVDVTELETVIGSDVDTGKVTIDFSSATVTTGAVDGNGEMVETAPVDTVEIPAEVIAEIAEAVADPENNAESLEVVLGDGASIEFDAVSLAEKVAQAGGDDITISIKPTTAVAETLSEAILFTVGESVAFDITVTSGGVAISDMGGNITISAPYELSEGETAEGVVVYYVDAEGNREKCETTYDAATGRVSWVTNHLSVYMVAYEAPADDGAADDGAATETPADDAQSSSPVLWIVIAVVVVIAIVAAVVVSKKRKA